MRTARVVAGVLCVLLFTPFPAYAQSSVSEIDHRVLQQLYDAFLKKEQKDTYLEKRIADERSRIRSLIDEELNALVNPQPVEGEAPQDLRGVVERQKSIVNALEERLQERKVDLDLLLEEEKEYYLAPGEEDEGEAYRLTETHAELLAKKAILEERIAALGFFLLPQQERQQKLAWQQRIEQFSFTFTIGKYVFALLLIVFAEKFIRTRVLTKIQNRNRRYTVMKMFASGVYLLVMLWLLGLLFTEYPRIITSFAIVGAGLAVALQDVVKDIIGWLVIVQGRRFSLGQRVAIGAFTGDIIDIGLLRTTLLEVSTVGASDLERSGKTLYVPNAMILTQPVLNYNTTSDFIKAELPITITYGSDWKQAEAILLQILQEETGSFTDLAQRQSLSRTQQFYFSHELRGPTIFLDIAPNGITLALRFYVPIGQRRPVVSKIVHKVLERFAVAEPPVDLAYPTTRVFATELGPGALA